MTVADGTNNSNSNSNDFYFESIADQVRLQRQLTAEAKLQMSDGQTWRELLAHRYSLCNLNFDMWVGLPEDMKKALQASEEGTDAHTVLNGNVR